ncbi:MULTISPECIES: DNA circularization N-terminal domain-containing protein [Roseomonadaceae]|uniref:DNA circularization N-terminal domain-containing protein n=1 Tax=Falsiroseomonas oleicola TaxID=2801474 RepID=A0ABS6HEP5_9PROT|nr:DNA circularization N-terminal domain-containing protein [Roseomonas oleicola]MBU8547232.1 DNA circularization N-terminal domain-containing protein [Roseomonas oleicola]
MSGTLPYRPAAWRGVPFEVWNMEGSFGRATTIHEYPFRDSVWVEDTGRATRRLGLIGFRVGDDVAALELEMIEAAEAEEPGELLHPTLGLLKVSLVEFHTRIRHDLGRVVELHFLFVEDGSRRFPDVIEDFGGRIAALADALDEQAAGSFVQRAGAALTEGVAVVRSVQQTLGQYTAQANQLMGDARVVMNAVGMVAPGLNRSFGRFAAGYRQALAPVTAANATTARALNGVAAARRGAARAADLVSSLAARL